MKKRYVVFGVDRFGAAVARTLEKGGSQVIAVDIDPGKIQMISEDVSYAMTADVLDPDAIDGLGLKNIDGAVITMVDHMEASIVTAMTCIDRHFPYVLARAKNEVHGRILEKLGVDRIIYPEQEMGTRVGKFMDDRDFMDWIALSPDYSLVEVRVPKEWIDKSLMELELRKKCSFNVVGLKNEDGIIVTPDPDMKLPGNVMMYIIGHNEDLEKIKE